MPIEVWDELEWAAAKPANNQFPRLETPPSRGWAKLFRPFTGEDRFHALFQPALSSLNGWTVHPQDLLESAILECQVLTRFKLMLEVEVLKTTRLLDLNLPEEPSASLGPLETSTGTRCQSGPLHYFETDYEGDAGGWAVCREAPDGRLHVILANHWTPDTPLPPAQATNRPLTAEQQAHLLAFPVEEVD